MKNWECAAAAFLGYLVMAWGWPWLARWMRRRRRALDMQILWPEMCRQAKTLDHAKAAFAFHAAADPAWTRDYSHDELVAFIDKLESA